MPYEVLKEKKKKTKQNKIQKNCEKLNIKVEANEV